MINFVFADLATIGRCQRDERGLFPDRSLTADAALLSRLEYASVKGFYLLQRSVSQRVQIAIRERLVPTDDLV
jgi:hypothetical protein